MMKLQFLGAAQTVTGSRTLLDYDHKRILIDCGLFQGPRSLRQRNWDHFPEADKIDAVILTHAHIDHSGYLPKLVKDGFRGPIHCSKGTADLLRPLLLDAAHLQEEDAEFANRTRHSKHSPALPLFTEKDAYAALELVQAHERNQWYAITPRLNYRFLRAGHILGASIVQLTWMDTNGAKEEIRTITFSGDLGHDRSPLLKGPEAVLETDYLILESTYGDRSHSRKPPHEELAALVQRVATRGGVLVIPAFSIGRTQDILVILNELENAGRVPKLPIFLDSPMSQNVTEIYKRHPEDQKYFAVDPLQESPLEQSRFITVKSADESMLLCMRDGPMIVISAAGMLSGGRILHHLKHRLPDPRNAVLFVGFQAAETKGRLLQNGIQDIRIHHQLVTVEAEIVTIDGFSAHGDVEDLTSWVARFQRRPKTIFLNHGEPEALFAFKNRLQTEFPEISVEIAELSRTWLLNGVDSVLESKS
jgi:metallo-beta-lactamase family protein